MHLYNHIMYIRSTSTHVLLCICRMFLLTKAVVTKSFPNIKPIGIFIAFDVASATRSSSINPGSRVMSYIGRDSGWPLIIVVSFPGKYKHLY